MINWIWLLGDVDLLSRERARIEKLAGPGGRGPQEFAAIKKVKRANKSPDGSDRDENNVRPGRSREAKAARKIFAALVDQDRSGSCRNDGGRRKEFLVRG